MIKGHMNIKTLVDYVEGHRKEFVNYFETLLYPNGKIELARPSHVEALYRYCMIREKKSRESLLDSMPVSFAPLEFICEKYGIISIWYYEMITPPKEKITEEQHNSLQLLIENNIIPSNIRCRETHEYSLYLERKEKGWL